MIEHPSWLLTNNDKWLRSAPKRDGEVLRRWSQGVVCCLIFSDGGTFPRLKMLAVHAGSRTHEIRTFEL